MIIPKNSPIHGILILGQKNKGKNRTKVRIEEGGDEKGNKDERIG